jgi:hypothetical protein
VKPQVVIGSQRSPLGPIIFDPSSTGKYWELPGVESTGWSADGGGLPLVVEGLGVAVLGFLFGLLLAYLIELRRRYNAQWTW